MCPSGTEPSSLRPIYGSFGYNELINRYFVNKTPDTDSLLTCFWCLQYRYRTIIHGRHGNSRLIWYVSQISCLWIVIARCCHEMQFLVVSNYFTVTAIYMSRSYGPVRLHRHQCQCLRIRLRNTLQDDKWVLNFERCRSGRWRVYLSEVTKKNHKIFVLNGRRKWLTE